MVGKDRVEACGSKGGRGNGGVGGGGRLRGGEETDTMQKGDNISLSDLRDGD